MKKIALVSITLNAVNPMTEYLQQQPEIEIRNYLDSYLTDKIKADGNVSDAAMERMFHMLSCACRDGADGIILTCTVFSPYVKYFQNLLSVPIIGADAAMMDQVGQKGGSTIVLCTFPAALKPSEKLLHESYRKHENDGRQVVIWLKEAYLAIQNHDFEKHDEVISGNVIELDGAYDNIVLAQISMAAAGTGIVLKQSQLFLSPEAALKGLLEII